MKIKSMLFPTAVVTLVAIFSYYIGGGSMRGTHNEQQLKVNVSESKESDTPKIDAVEATNRGQIAKPDITLVNSEQMKAIEDDFERRKQKIEDYYTNEFRRLRENVEIALKRIDFADKTAYAHFMEQLNNTKSTSTGYTNVTGRVSPYGNVSADAWHTGTTRTRVEGKPAANYEFRARQLKNEADNLIDEYRTDLYLLQRKKDYDLSELEKAKKQAIISASYQNLNAQIQKNTHIPKGTVTCILSSEENSLAVINGDVLKEGQKIKGVKVIKINQDSVEFENAGSRWSQKVNEQPSTNWP